MADGVASVIPVELVILVAGSSHGLVRRSSYATGPPCFHEATLGAS